MIGISADITERKKAEEALRAAERRKDTFLATLAHELRNPLAPIRYATRLLEPGVPPEMAADARRMIDRQLAHMARLFDDLLDVSRVTRGVLTIHKEVIDLREAIESAVEAARPIAAGAGIEVATVLPSTPLAVNGDATRLAQIISNLLSNAIKYTNEGGHITVAAQIDGHEILIRVQDDGAGISPDLLPRVFHLFVQGEPSGTRAAGGLGIGLSLARELIELHQGSIDAASAGLGHGSEFRVRLPRSVEKPAVAERLAAPEKVTVLGASQLRILVCDDNVDAADTLASVLKLVGYNTTTAYDGHSALTVAEQIRPDIVLLDLGLPDKSGTEVARQIRSQPWGSHIWLIAVTGWGREDDRKRSREAGFDEHLTKPVDPQELLQLIGRPARGAA